MKLIKFDLPINGTKVHDIEMLRDNFTTEILELHNSGTLLRWLKSRNLMSEAEKLSAMEVTPNAAENLAILCKIFGIDADRNMIDAALTKADGVQGISLSKDNEELLNSLKENMLFLNINTFNLLVKDKIEIENQGEIMDVAFDKKFHKGVNRFAKTVREPYTRQLKQIGDLIEIGDPIFKIKSKNHEEGFYVSPYKGILVGISDFQKGESEYRYGDSMFQIRVNSEVDKKIGVLDELRVVRKRMRK